MPPQIQTFAESHDLILQRIKQLLTQPIVYEIYCLSGRKIKSQDQSTDNS